MKNYKKLGRVFFALLLCINPQIFSMAHDTPTDSEHIISIKNNSEWMVRISVGSFYPNSIALDPGQIISFPQNKVSAITASSYGKISHYVGVVGCLDIATLLQEQPDFQSRNITVEITYQKTEKSFWNFARHLFTQGTWAFSVDSFNQEPTSRDGIQDLQDEIYAKISSLSSSTPEAIMRDAAHIWSMFPRAATKILDGQSVYPFNILSLDIGGFIATDEQLRNWGTHVYTSMKQRFAHIESQEIWNAVKTLIADSVESLRLGKYYADRDPGYLLTVLHTSNKQEEPSFSAALIEQLKVEVKDNSSAQALLEQLEQTARDRGWIKKEAPPAPPAPPMPSEIIKRPYQETAIANYMREFERKRPEEQTLFDKVVMDIFEQINAQNAEPKTAMLIKYATLDKLRFVSQSKAGTSQLTNILKYMTPIMIRLAHTNQNPQYTMQEWLSRIGQSPRQIAFEYSQIQNEQELQGRVQSDEAMQGHQESLIALLRMSFAKFRN